MTCISDLDADLIGEIACWARAGSLIALRATLRFDLRHVACVRIQRLCKRAIKSWNHGIPAVGARVFVKKHGYGTVDGSTAYEGSMEDGKGTVKWKVMLERGHRSIFFRRRDMKLVEPWEDGPWNNTVGLRSAKEAALISRGAAAQSLHAAAAVLQMAAEETWPVGQQLADQQSALAFAAARTACGAAATATSAEMAAELQVSSRDSLEGSLTGDAQFPAACAGQAQAMREMEALQHAMDAMQATIDQPRALSPAAGALAHGGGLLQTLDLLARQRAEQSPSASLPPPPPDATRGMLLAEAVGAANAASFESLVATNAAGALDASDGLPTTLITAASVQQADSVQSVATASQKLVEADLLTELIVAPPPATAAVQRRRKVRFADEEGQTDSALAHVTLIPSRAAARAALAAAAVASGQEAVRALELSNEVCSGGLLTLRNHPLPKAAAGTALVPPRADDVPAAVVAELNASRLGVADVLSTAHDFYNFSMAELDRNRAASVLQMARAHRTAVVPETAPWLAPPSPTQAAPGRATKVVPMPFDTLRPSTGATSVARRPKQRL